jgi:cation diffusion facilitator family transporter
MGDIHEKARAGSKVTWIGLWVNLLLSGVKFWGGYIGHSQGLIADAVHSLSDLFTDAVVLVGLVVSGKSPDEKHPFGHARLETMASAVIGLALVGVAIEIGYNAGQDIYRHDTTQPNWLAAIVAALSIISKEVLYQYTVRVGRRINSPSVLANAWHHRSDAMSSVAVLAGVTAGLVNPGWHILDAYAALLVSFLVLKVGLDITLTAVREFTDTAPDPAVIEEIKACAAKINGVRDVHDLKVRTAGGLYQMELHIVVDAQITVNQGHGIAKEVEACLVNEIKNCDRIIIHVDPDPSNHPEPDHNRHRNS